MKLKRYVERGEIVPLGYGYSYTEHWRRRDVFYPFPLNWIIRYARILWFKVRHPRQAYSDDNAINEARLEVLQRITRYTTQLESTTRWFLGEDYKMGAKRTIQSINEFVDYLTEDYTHKP